MTEIRDVDNKWSLLTTFDPPLQKGLQLIVAPKALSRDAGTLCRLVDWQYRIANKEGAETELTVDLELIVEEIHPGLWESWFASWSPDTQGLAPMLAAGVTFILGAVALLLWHAQPDLVWTLAGRHIRTITGTAIVALFMFVLPMKLGLYKGQSFLRSFFAAFLVLAGWLVLGVWLTFSARPERFGGSDADYATYAKALATRLSTSYWPFLVAALPWLSVGFKVFGFDVADKTAEGIEKAAIKEK